MSEPPTMDTLELYVHSSAFDNECALYSKGSPSNDSDSDCYSPNHNNLWENEDDSSSTSSDESSRYDVPKLEAYLYYFGIRGPRHQGPKLIFRTSKDVFTPPSGPEQHPRLMKLLPVYEHNELGRDDLWTTIRSKVVELLDQRNIKHSSIDLVRFSWLEENVDDNKDDEENVDDESDEDTQDVDSKIPLYGKIVTTPVTIWVGVLPDTLTSKVAFHSSNDILGLLKEHDISDVDVAYRESVARAFSGPKLFAPVSDLDPLKAVIDPITTALSLPIAGLKTLNSQGTMGFYFRVGEDIYGVTARHVLFPEDEGNDPYIYVAGPKKEVVIMGTRAFTNFLMSIQGHIGTLNHMVSILEKRVMVLTKRSKGGGPNAEQAARELAKTEDEQLETKKSIEELKKFFIKMKKQWTKPKDRVIGHVVWAPPVSVSTAPHNYTKDLCVIKLDERKFFPNFRGNVLDLGPEIGASKFTSLMYPRIDAPSDFDYPDERLLKLQGILSANEMRTPNNNDHKGDPMRYVIKRGLTTHTTIGCLTGFESHVRRYFALGSRNSVEAAVYPYDNDSGPFSRGGDSGSIIVDALGKFVALLTGGTGPTDISDITFGTPMYWLWEIIKAKFPSANLYFEDDNSYSSLPSVSSSHTYN
ncbi:hypothetical protein FRC19_003842 [Serendipita sp. 401]|nr:hypothetical protein FRC15_003352 [Serendipita sp. 397]KAG8797976.1 hypothetical protein FRC16_008241 [Serendipita sp. 398]KAG8828503.1 hypothetical protein FRC19_003842 [Serendipita sp. 401]KAG8862053.1 hypothetical protein FRC20_011387 [Serendipita sp. 405]KAG9058625.1 hypothetical protein FS842_008047 [Serendipita sp. 407]